MTLNVLFAAGTKRWSLYETPLREALTGAGVTGFQLARDFAPDTVDVIIYAPDSPLQDFTPFRRLGLVQNLWAGVEAVAGNDTLTAPLARMVDPGLTQGMCEWVLGHALRHHLGSDRYLRAAPGTWKPQPPPLTWDRKVSVLGLGELGAACAGALARVGFDVAGWSRTPKDIDGITCLSGRDGLEAALARAEITVLLLPDTPVTENTLDAGAIARMPRGAFVINPGRGALIDDNALLAALDSGQIGGATLDVFRTEPLPADHPYWHHPKVLVTPHIAAETRPRYSSLTVAENIRRLQAGEPLLHLVDRALGY